MHEVKQENNQTNTMNDRLLTNNQNKRRGLESELWQLTKACSSNTGIL